MMRLKLVNGGEENSVIRGDEDANLSAVATEEIWMNTGRFVIGDSWFASVKADFCGIIPGS